MVQSSICEHRYEYVSSRWVHYPSYEPLRRLIVVKCSKCGAYTDVLLNVDDKLGKLLDNYDDEMERLSNER